MRQGYPNNYTTVLLYAAPTHRAGKRLRRIVDQLVTEEHKEFYQSITRLTQRLRRPLGERPIGVFLARDADELATLLSVRDLLRDLRVILVVQGHKEDTLSLAHALCPRYVTYADGDLDDVAAVMGKMMGKHGRDRGVGQ